MIKYRPFYVVLNSKDHEVLRTTRKRDVLKFLNKIGYYITRINVIVTPESK